MYTLTACATTALRVAAQAGSAEELPALLGKWARGGARCF